MKKIFLRISGGIGNQLFQIINGHNYALKKNYKIFYYLDKNDQYKRIFYLKNLCQNLDIQEIEPNEVNKLPVVNDIIFFDENQYFNEQYIKPPYRIEASLQNWHFFYSERDFYSQIIKTSIENKNNKSSFKNSDNLLHIRLKHSFSDNNKKINKAKPLHPLFSSLMIKSAFQESKSDLKKLNFVSDTKSNDPILKDYLNQISLNNPEIYFKNISSDNPIYDLIKFYKTKSILIGSNSTFSWWGIFLNNEAKCYSPYLGNLEMWLRNIPSTKQFFYPTKKYNHINHSGDSYSKNYSPLHKGFKIINKCFLILGNLVPFFKKFIINNQRNSVNSFY